MSLFDTYTADATSAVLSSGSDWRSGDLTDVEADSKEGDLKLVADGVWGPRNLKTPPATLTSGASYVADGSQYIYVMRGSGQSDFWRYDITLNKWDELSDLPAGAYIGSDLEILGGYVYAVFGGYQKTFARYSITSDSWEFLDDVLDFVYYGGSITTDGTDLYVLRGGATSDFYKYIVSTGDWAILSDTIHTMYYSDITYLDGYIYAHRGVNQNWFYRYDVAGDAWETRANLPAGSNGYVNMTTDGTYLYLPRSGNQVNFYRYDPTGNSWTSIADAPATVNADGGVVYNEGDGDIYFFRGNNTPHIWRYDIATDSFVGPEQPPATLSTGSDLVQYGGYLYAPRGSNSSTFYRYDVAGNSWETRANTPANFAYDSKGIVAGSYLYFYRGTSTSFYRYDPTGNSWSTMASVPSNVGVGASLAYPGSGDYIYGTRGSVTGTFWRYSITGDSWDDDIVADLPIDGEAGEGARLFSDGTDIYASAGRGMKRFFKYDISGDTWTELANLPFSPSYGTDITYYNGKAFALGGWYESTLWEYDLSGDSWRRLPSIDTYLGYETGTYAGASIESDGSGSFYITRGNSTDEMTVFTPGSNAYPTDGTWVSGMQDYIYVDSWDGLTTVETTPSDSAITYETRSSTDGATWSSWEAVTGGAISSPARRYLEIRATLASSSDQSETPVLHSVQVDYTGDENAPSNPTTITAKSQEVGGETLVDGESYTYSQPFFSWSGATDAETSVDNYYVYFGDNVTADPEIDGYFQSENDYVVTTPMEAGTYYLRIQSVDTLDNISSAVTLFTYVYAGVSPPQTVAMTDTADFSGTATNVATASDQIMLAGKEGFWLESDVPRTPSTLQYGAKNVAYSAAENKLYILRGANSKTFYSFDLISREWSTLSDAPDNVRMGGGVVEGPDGFLYGAQGNNTDAFWRYDIASDTWSDANAADFPSSVYYGGSIRYDGSQYIYALKGGNDDSFWRYDTLTDSWEILSNVNFGNTDAVLNSLINTGGNMTLDVANNLIYVTQGNLRDGFGVYDIISEEWSGLPSVPALPSHGSAIAYVPDENKVYYTSGNTSTGFYVYDVSSEEWSPLTDTPSTINYGGSLTLIGEELYAVRGGNTYDVYIYDLNRQGWKVPTRGLFGGVFEGVTYETAQYGADIVYGDGNNVYVMRGQWSDDFVRYNTVTGEVTQMARLPMGAYLGASLEYVPDEGRIYFQPGQYVQKFYYYDISTDTWTELANDPPPANTGHGSSMAYDGSQYIYLARGAGSNGFYRYDTDGSAGSRWDTMDTAPSTLGYGAELVLKDGYIYTLRGYNTANNPFYRYDIAGDSWSDAAVADLSIDVYQDAFLVDGGDGYLYATRADNDNDFFRYSISEDLWEQITNFPTNAYRGGAGTSNGTNRIYALSGDGTSAFSDGIYTYVQETTTSSFEGEGTYVSQTHDLSAVYRWAGLQVTYESALNTVVTIETRSSDDGSTWDDWAPVGEVKRNGTSYEYKITSEAQQYMQVRFTLASSDSVLSGIVDDYTISYYQDITDPVNPSDAGLTAYAEDTEMTTISSDTWYSYPTPHFTWPEAGASNGATDENGSGVSGYYVYFGIDESADPETAGTLQSGVTYTAANLDAGETYYLRIKTVDDAGNVTDSAWQPFVYRYDNEGPPEPENLVADPSGYSAINSFDFSWSAVSDDDGSPVSEYCYKTNADSGEYAVDQCTTATSLAGLPASQTGQNTLYVRTRDTAGNYSAYTTIAYYYSATAPSPPSDLTVTPSENTENSFAFSWDTPTSFSGAESKLTYFYSVNTLPTVFSVIETTETALEAGPFATVPGENTFYVLAQDEAGNIDYNLYASVTFTADTSAPGAPLDIDIGDLSVKLTESWKLAVSWESPTDAGSGVHSYQIYRSIDGDAFEFHATAKGISYVDTELIQRVHWYKVRACDSTNNCGAFSSTVSLFPDGKFTVPADLVADPVASNISTKRAQVSWTTNRTCDSKIAFGKESGVYFDEEVANSDHVTAHVLGLTNLEPGTTYYYVTKWTDEDGNTGVSEEQSFTTAPPPTVSNVETTSVGIDSAIISFTVKDAVKATLLYGESINYGGAEELQTSLIESTYTVQLTNLLDDTEYHYLLRLDDAEGDSYTYEDHIFNTPPRPRVSDVTIQQIRGTAQPTVLVRWESNTAVSSIVTVAPASTPGASWDEIDLERIAGAHQMVVRGVLPQTTYSLVVRGRDQFGNEATSGTIEFTTATDTRPPRIENISVEGSIVPSSEGGESVAQLIITWQTDEPTTSQVEYGEGTGTVYAQKTQQDGTLTLDHVVVISGLTPSKVYHFRAISQDAAGNEGLSIDTVTITPKATQSALDLVVGNLSEIFGFLRGI